MKKQKPIQDTVNISIEDEENMETNDNQTPVGNENLNEDLQPQMEVESNLNNTSSSEENAGELDKLRAEIEEHQQRLLRTQADYDNFRRRTVKEKDELGKYASAKLITELLPVIDNFERALNIKPEHAEAASYSKGVEMIFRQLEGVLQAEGLSAMTTVGQPFNPEYHQAIMQVESDEYEEGTVVEEVQKGYILKDKVLRPAMVKVSG